MGQNEKCKYRKITDKILSSILAGQIMPGQKLKPARELALDFNVSVNTVQRSFSELKRIGIIVCNRNIGHFVTDDIYYIKKVRDDKAEQVLCDYYKKMKLLGYSDDEMKRVIHGHASSKEW